MKESLYVMQANETKMNPSQLKVVEALSTEDLSSGGYNGPGFFDPALSQPHPDGDLDLAEPGESDRLGHSSDPYQNEASTRPDPHTTDPYASVIVKLLSGEMYEQDKAWADLLEYRIPVSDYFTRIGIEVIIDQREGFAFLRQQPLDDTGRTIGLIKRTPLSYEVTLLLVLLRELLEDYETQDTTSPACFVSHTKIQEELELFFKDQSNKVKLLRQLDRYIRQVIDLGFLKLIETPGSPTTSIKQYEIRRILKAKVTPDVLEDVRRRMESDFAKQEAS